MFVSPSPTSSSLPGRGCAGHRAGPWVFTIERSAREPGRHLATRDDIVLIPIPTQPARPHAASASWARITPARSPRPVCSARWSVAEQTPRVKHSTVTIWLVARISPYCAVTGIVATNSDQFLMIPFRSSRPPATSLTAWKLPAISRRGVGWIYTRTNRVTVKGAHRGILAHRCRTGDHRGA